MIREINTYTDDTCRLEYLLQQDNGQPVDLTGVTVVFMLKNTKNQIVNLQYNSEVISQQGTVKIKFNAPQPGKYVATFRLIYPNGDKITYDRFMLNVSEI